MMLVTLKFGNGLDLCPYFPTLEFNYVTKIMNTEPWPDKTWILKEAVVDLDDPMQFMKDNASIELDEYTSFDPPYKWIIEFMGEEYPYDAELTLYSEWCE